MPRKKVMAQPVNEKNESTGNVSLFEISWEVCNQIGGIYSVIRSKAPAMAEKWGERYVLLGPYFASHALSEFEPESEHDDPISRALKKLKALGIETHAGRWLVTGKPRVVLFNVISVYSRLAEIRHAFWQRLGSHIPEDDDLLTQSLALSFCLREFFKIFLQEGGESNATVAHFHEWLAGAAIPLLREAAPRIRTVFTTHATLLGRYIATNDSAFAEQLPHLDWEHESRRYGIEARVRLEREAAGRAHCFTTVSEVTARECLQFLGRKPDVITPNGLNLERFAALHEFQNLHREYKEMITQFVLGHFFPSYSFDLDKTLFFFTSGRYEHRNKGFDLTLEALLRLNQRLKQERSQVTVVMFIITKRPVHSINPEVMHSRTLVEEIRRNCSAMLKQIQDKLVSDIAARREHELPPLNRFIDDYWNLRLKRTLASFTTDRLPIVVTHNLVSDGDDEILNFLRRTHLVNHASDRVKIVYHPDFIIPTNPLFGLEYGQFVRGCHLGIFPSAYEPWGYTPLECVANGIPAVTSDLSGFGDYVMRTIPDHADKGIWVVNRRSRTFESAAVQLAEVLHAFVGQTRRERITQRNLVESSSASFDWHHLLTFYDQAYDKARGVS